MRHVIIPIGIMILIVILMGVIVLGAYLESSVAENKALREALQRERSNTYLLSNYYIEEKEKVYMFTSPMASIKFTSPYGYREYRNPFTGGQITSDHKGLDIVGNWHTEVKPIAKYGKVIDKWYVPTRTRTGHPVFGGYVRIEHEDGWISGYGHLSSIYVREGDVLKDGLFYRNGKVISSKGVLGRQGNTGQSTGEHLHLSIMDNEGKFIDPMEIVDFN